MSITMPVYVPPKTRQWATSAVVLGAIYFLMSLPSAFNSHKSFAMFGDKAWVGLTIVILHVILSIIFMVSGAAVLKGRSWGRETLAYVSAAAIVVTILGSVWEWIAYHDPALTARIARATGGAGSPLPGNFVSIMIMAMSVGTIVFGVIQIVYCALLYRHMSGEPMEAQPVGYSTASHDQAAWPPPPAQ